MGPKPNVLQGCASRKIYLPGYSARPQLHGCFLVLDYKREVDLLGKVKSRATREMRSLENLNVRENTSN